MIQEFRLVRATKVVNLTLPVKREGLGTEPPKEGYTMKIDFVGKNGVSVPKKKMAHRTASTVDRGKKLEA